MYKCVQELEFNFQLSLDETLRRFNFNLATHKLTPYDQLGESIFISYWPKFWPVYFLEYITRSLLRSPMIKSHFPWPTRQQDEWICLQISFSSSCGRRQETLFQFFQLSKPIMSTFKVNTLFLSIARIVFVRSGKAA